MSIKKFDINKIKSIVSGTYKRPTYIGWTPSLDDVNRKEGEEWTDENNNTWIIKNGYRVKKPKKSTIIHRKICDDCKANIEFSNIYYLDIRTWNAVGLCHECFFKKETKLKQEGKWELFNKKRDLLNEQSAIKDNITQFNEALKWCLEKTGKPLRFMNEDGSPDDWNCNDDLSVIIKDIKDDLKFLNERLKKIEKELSNINKEEEKNKNEKTK